MTDRPTLSVALVTYNHAPYVAEALRGIFRQQCPFPVEVVVADDCSTDETPGIIRLLSADAPHRLRVLANARRLGMHGNYERVLRACTGRYIAILEGDDYWTDPHKLRDQVAFMDAHPTCTVSGHAVRVLDDRTGAWAPDPYAGRAIPPLAGFAELVRENFLCTCSVVWRNGVVRRWPGWLRRLRMVDWPLHLLHARGGQVGYLARPMAAYRVHGGGVWSSAGDERRLAWLITALTVMRTRFGRQAVAAFDHATLRYLFEYVYLLRSHARQSRAVKSALHYACLSLTRGYVDGRLLRVLAWSLLPAGTGMPWGRWSGRGEPPAADLAHLPCTP